VARLGSDYPLDNSMENDFGFNEAAKLTKASNALPLDQIVGSVVKFPVADGYALYYVSSARPLTLQHIPAGDAYTVHPAMIRGLTKKDILDLVRFDRMWSKR
jgi:hypothetical protein